jgi:hypothetical protein
MAPSYAIWLSGICLAALFSISASIAFGDGQKPRFSAPTTAPSPRPELAPKAVVKIVLDALKANDANDNGIRTTFKFASPANQQATGPIERFIPLVKSPAYLPMINCRSADVRELAIDADKGRAAELAIIVDSNGDKAFYVFQLARQTDGDLKDCWMTDGVVRVEPSDPQTKPPGNPDQKLTDGQFPA